MPGVVFNCNRLTIPEKDHVSDSSRKIKKLRMSHFGGLAFESRWCARSRPQISEGAYRMRRISRRRGPGADSGEVARSFRDHVARLSRPAGQCFSGGRRTTGQSLRADVGRVRRRLSPARSMGVVDEAVEDGIGIGWVADYLVPFVDWDLAGQDGEPNGRATRPLTKIICPEVASLRLGYVQGA
jgi:hypothetical protein